MTETTEVKPETSVEQPLDVKDFGAVGDSAPAVHTEQPPEPEAKKFSPIVEQRGMISLYDRDHDDVTALQQALNNAGYRIDADGNFGPRTDAVVRQFQKQRGLTADGKVGLKTAYLLDTFSHQELVANAAPIIRPNELGVITPHDDTASLLAFYGDPRPDLERWKANNVVGVNCPWTLYYDGEPWPHPIPFHKKVASNLKRSFDTIWAAANKDDKSPLLVHVRNFSGSGNFRPVRNSSRLSTHAFWAAIDFDAETLPLGHGVTKASMPEQVVNTFIACGAFWGGNYTGRKDPMHFQWAHE